MRSHSSNRQHKTQHNPSTTSALHPHNDSNYAGHLDQENLSRYESNGSTRPGVIQEVSEPVSPDDVGSSRKSSPVSALTELIRNSPSSQEESLDLEESVGSGGEEMPCDEGYQAVTVRKGIISQPTVRTKLLLRRAMSGHETSSVYGSITDLESQKTNDQGLSSWVRVIATHTRESGELMFGRILNPRSWNRQAIWTYGFRQPLSYVPPVILGLLLNILDALSYGRIRVEPRVP